MSRYIYNITLTCEAELLEEILFDLRSRLLPAWRSYDGVSAVRLLRLPDDGGFALQTEGEQKDALEALDLLADPELHRLIRTYGRTNVLPFLTKLELLE